MNNNNLTLEEYVRLCCKRSGVSLSDVARSIGKKPPNFLNQLARGNFRVSDLEKIGDAIGCDFFYEFIPKE